MEYSLKPLCLLLLLSLLTGDQGVEGFFFRHYWPWPRHHPQPPYRRPFLHPVRPAKLFVFGDSYGDTGNKQLCEGRAWRYPYGISLGKPTGRFSDGILLTDYVARYLGLKTPEAYHWSEFALRYLKSRSGMNYAYGGTGVFDTSEKDPNMTTQIDLFERQFKKEKLFSPIDISSSLALITLSGNDYSYYERKNPNLMEILRFQTNVTNQLKVDLKRIHDLGVRKVVVTTLQPLGCLPMFTVSNNFKKCNGTVNMLVDFHNAVLRELVADLNNQTKSNSSFTVLDLNSAFATVINNGTGLPKLKHSMNACCMGISSEYNCGNVDKNGTKLYTMCKNPKKYFFWDSVHPTQAGWSAVFTTLLPSLPQVFF